MNLHQLVLLAAMLVAVAALYAGAAWLERKTHQPGLRLFVASVIVLVGAIASIYSRHWVLAVIFFIQAALALAVGLERRRNSG